jgi:hypothetical protein
MKTKAQALEALAIALLPPERDPLHALYDKDWQVKEEERFRIEKAKREATEAAEKAEKESFERRKKKAAIRIAKEKAEASATSGHNEL